MVAEQNTPDTNARSEQTDDEERSQLLAVLADAVRTIDRCDTCSITLRNGPNTSSAATYDSTALDLDQAQYAEDSGPCLSAFRSLEVVSLPRIVPGVGRYEHFRETAASAGILSSLSVPFRVDARRRGSLNLYSRSADAFGPEAEARALDLTATIRSLYAADS